MNSINLKQFFFIIIIVIYLLINENYFVYNHKNYIHNNFNYINVAYAFDNNYYYIAQVSMKSIMLNQNNNTFIKFYILVHENIYDKQKEIINKICLDHINCNISYFLLKDEFKNINTTTAIIKRTKSAFYRLLLQELLPKENKILYFDCDTLIYKDLNKLYNYNITDKYYVGKYERISLSRFGTNLSDFINTGVLLINLENLRNDKIFPKIYEFLIKYNNTLKFLDQDAINVVCNKKIGFFPSYYISSGVCNSNTLKNLTKNKQNNKVVIQNLKEPYIFHFNNYRKPWFGIAQPHKMICYDFFPRFYEYARKTDYYFEILEIFKVFVSNEFKYK